MTAISIAFFGLTSFFTPTIAPEPKACLPPNVGGWGVVELCVYGR